ncbi:hypothetical protein AV530_003952 [Patagioenas fasciata monilis]|uniref:Uncharacterized protein n=1 Tax=Patagioenas fasciata monilis TaxID=372326 RepID=A0A1V4JH10_PATFA|nr:hypothetical protein AV530_003952 [Patagioenas fasciata monilis]
MTEEKMLDPSFPLVASALVPRLDQLVCGELVAPTQVFLGRSIVQSDEKLVISASWAKDDDISRLLKSLPNWSNMAQPKQLRPKREEEEDFIRQVKASM